MTSGWDSAMKTTATTGPEHPGTEGTRTPAGPGTSGTGMLRAAREFLMTHRTDYDTAIREFSWPRPTTFNFRARLVRRDRRGAP